MGHSASTGAQRRDRLACQKNSWQSFAPLSFAGD
jgi:hypothetical protein